MQDSLPVKPGKTFGVITLKDIAVFSVFLYIVFSLVFEGSSVLKSGALASLGLYICLGCCVLYCLIAGKVKINWFVWGLLVFGVVLSVSYAYSPERVYSSPALYRYWTSFVLAVLVFNVLTEYDDVQRVLTAYIVGGVVLSLFVYGHYGIDYLVNSGTRLKNGDFGNVNALGLDCATAIVLAFYKLISMKREEKFRTRRAFLIAAIVICLPIMLFTGSRKAILSMLIAVCVLIFLFNNNKSFTKRFFLILTIIAGAYLVVNFIPAFAPLKNRLTRFFESVFNESDQTQSGNMVVGDANRLYYIQKGMELFAESPIWGNGFCYSYYTFGKYSHNNYVELLMNNGIIGFVAYYWIYVKIIKDSIRLKERRDIMALVGMLMAKLLFEEMGVVDHYSRMTLLLLGIIAACITTAQKQQRALREEIQAQPTMQLQQKQA